ncbi:MAG: mannose-6-phosphate isomerase-like protein (cupin superfamily) [Candidatus Omnitrophota bacterium]|jgi:mannose-6-phosphate isomerase-like protein (cupin superfamily)
MHKIIIIAVAFISMLCITSLNTQAKTTLGGKIISPNDVVQSIEWTKAELGQDIAKRDLFINSVCSHHIIRLSKSEAPHTHPNRDLSIIILSGAVHMHYGDRKIVARQGDVIIIPHGEEHWAEVAANKIAVAYAIFTQAE